jgi:hypothetical protein
LARKERVLLKLMIEINNVLEPVQEPLVNLGELPEALDSVALVEGIGNHKEALVGGD